MGQVRITLPILTALVATMVLAFPPSTGQQHYHGDKTVVRETEMPAIPFAKGLWTPTQSHWARSLAGNEARHVQARAGHGVIHARSPPGKFLDGWFGECFGCLNPTKPSQRKPKSGQRAQEPAASAESRVENEDAVPRAHKPATRGPSGIADDGLWPARARPSVGPEDQRSVARLRPEPGLDDLRTPARARSRGHKPAIPGQAKADASGSRDSRSMARVRGQPKTRSDVEDRSRTASGRVLSSTG